MTISYAARPTAGGPGAEMEIPSKQLSIPAKFKTNIFYYSQFSILNIQFLIFARQFLILIIDFH